MGPTPEPEQARARAHTHTVWVVARSLTCTMDVDAPTQNLMHAAVGTDAPAHAKRVEPFRLVKSDSDDGVPDGFHLERALVPDAAACPAPGALGGPGAGGGNAVLERL